MCRWKRPNQIARILTEEQVLNPTNYYYRKTGAAHKSLDTTLLYRWISSSITAMLDNRTYLGHMPGLRTTTLSYINNKAVYHDEAKQMLAANTQEALITQELRQRKKRTNKQMDEPNLFSELVFCTDCGMPLVLHRAHTMDAVKNNFMCYTDKKKGKAITEIRALTPEILRLFISRIEVGEKSAKYLHTAEQAIRIVYRGVGIMDSVQPAVDESEEDQIA